MKKEKIKPLTVQDINDDKTDYSVYRMKNIERIGYFLIAFLLGAAVGYLFYGGIGKDKWGNPTYLTLILNILIPAVVGSLAGILFLPIRKKQIIDKRKTALHLQFRDLLGTLSTSIGAGKNISDSFKSSFDDLSIQYSEDAYILQELKIILSGINNNINIEEMLLDLGKRSGIDDILSFGNVFDTCYRKGGNIKDVIRNTQQIISDKIEIEMEIQTLVTSNKTEQYIMTAMPIGLIAMIKGMSPEFANNFVTPSGIISSTVAIVIFVIAYFVGKEVLSIKL